MRIKFVQKVIDKVRGKNKSKNKFNLKVPTLRKSKVFYREGGGIVVKDYGLFNKIVELNKSSDIPLFYNNLDTWSLKDVYEERFNRQMKFVKEKFIPLLKDTDEVCDMGCASGDFTFEMAKYCKNIDGYEMSQKMVDWANNYASENNIANAKFYQGTCETVKYGKKYDNMSLMGVLTYVLNDNDAENAVKSLCDALSSMGYLIYKDNANETNDDYYFFGPSPDYKMVARSKKKILEMFERNGFKVVAEDVFHNLKIYSADKKKAFEIISLGLILQKK